MAQTVMIPDTFFSVLISDVLYTVIQLIVGSLFRYFICHENDSISNKLRVYFVGKNDSMKAFVFN
jgi:hypothetical protein